MIEEEGLALRGTFVIDPDGMIKIIEIHDSGIGRDVTETAAQGQGRPVRRQPPGRSLPGQVEGRRRDAGAVARPGRQDLSLNTNHRQAAPARERCGFQLKRGRRAPFH